LQTFASQLSMDGFELAKFATAAIFQSGEITVRQKKIIESAIKTAFEEIILKRLKQIEKQSL